MRIVLEMKALETFEVECYNFAWIEIYILGLNVVLRTCALIEF